MHFPRSAQQRAQWYFWGIRLSVLLILALTGSSCSTDTRSTAPRESVFAKILNTRTIRCSYLIYSPYFRKDPNTGRLSGIFHDVMEEIGKNAGLKIEWVEQVGYENIFPGLKAGRYD